MCAPPILGGAHTRFGLPAPPGGRWLPAPHYSARRPRQHAEWTGTGHAPGLRALTAASREHPPGTEPDAVTAAAAAVRHELGADRGERLALWAATPGGCEPEAARELAALGWRPVAVTPPTGERTNATDGLGWERGAVYGTADLAALEATLRAARTITRVMSLLVTTEVDTLEEAGAAVRAAAPVLPDAPFAVDAERHGTHPFTSLDLARDAGAAVIAAHRARTGRRLPVDLENPTSVVRVELSGRRLRVGCELTAGSRHRRADLPRRHRAGLNPAIAAALVAMAGWRADTALLDPMCGAATILVEAARAALGVAPPLAAGDRLAALGLRDPRAAAAARDALAAVVDARRDTRVSVRGVELRAEHVADARANLAAAGLTGTVGVRVGDARRLADVDTEPVDLIVTNPPYGLRLGRSRELESLYTACLAALAPRLPAGGRVVWLTPSHRVATRAATAAGLDLADRRTIGLGAFDASACQFVRP